MKLLSFFKWPVAQEEAKDLIHKFAKQMREGGLITQHK